MSEQPLKSVSRRRPAWNLPRKPGLLPNVPTAWATDPGATCDECRNGCGCFTPAAPWVVITMLAVLSWVLDYLGLSLSVPAVGYSGWAFWRYKAPLRCRSSSAVPTSPRLAC